MLHSFYQNSQCKNSYLHRFTIKSEFTEGVMEVCEICKMRKFFRIIDGKVNNQAYMSYHIRQSLPSTHPFYYHEREFNPVSNEVVSPYI